MEGAPRRARRRADAGRRVRGLHERAGLDIDDGCIDKRVDSGTDNDHEQCAGVDIDPDIDDGFSVDDVGIDDNRRRGNHDRGRDSRANITSDDGDDPHRDCPPDRGAMH